MKTKPLPTQWNLGLLFASDSDPKIQKELAKIKKASYQFIHKWNPKVNSKTGYRDDYLRDPKILKQALDEYENWAKLYSADGKPGLYFSLRTAQDQLNPALKAKYNQVLDFAQKIENDIQFFELRLAKIPKAQQHKMLSSKLLTDYKHYLERLFVESKYLLSENEEKVINLYSPMAISNWTKLRSSFISKEEAKVTNAKGKSETKTFEDCLSLLSDSHKKVRDSAAVAVNAILAKHVDLAEAELNNVLQYKKVSDELRGFARPDESRHIADDIDSDVVDQLLAAVQSRYDLSQRYYTLKAKLLGVPKLAYHERNVELAEVEQKLSYEQAVEIVAKTFSKLDDEFADIFAKFVNEGHIDVYPKTGKSGGAFCTHSLITDPVYILLNFAGKLSDVTTIAHEVGHGINHELINQTQNALNAHSPMSTAEVASTFMEDFAIEELFQNVDDNTRLNLMMTKLNDDISTIMRQIACYLFERDLHLEFRKTGYVSKQKIGELFHARMAEYMGDAVEQSTGSENWWVYWSHVRYFFYVYSYSSGLLISKAMQAAYRRDHKFISQVKTFLSAGGAKSPREIFQDMDINIADMQFWQDGLDQVQRLLNEAEQLARKLGKI